MISFAYFCAGSCIVSVKCNMTTDAGKMLPILVPPNKPEALGQAHL